MHISNVKMHFISLIILFLGMPHTHGVLWTKTSDEVENAFTEVYNGTFTSGDVNHNLVADYIDQHVTCASDVDDDLSVIISEVQIHHHTKTCKKRTNTTCRFGFPRYPSLKTILAKPLGDDISEDDKIVLNKKYQTILKAVNSVLTDETFDKSISVQCLCDKAQVNIDDYHKALSVTTRGVVVVLKRSVKDIWVNNYNAEWLRAWNGNMDIQICLDLFAIITYITDYYSKDESGMTSLLSETWKSTKDKTTKERLHLIKETFLTHR
jgi:hypothetical protein